jgi:YfiH family protein
MPTLPILTSPLLSSCDWLDHGFGTRHSQLSQGGMADLKQIHSAVVWEADQAGRIGEGDALITRVPGVTVSVRTADCYPILLADTRQRVVAAVHAGWRGTHARIVEKTIEQMASDPRDVIAAIGPGIGACCYFVGDEVAQLFGLDHAGKIDLAAANRQQLLAMGVPDAQISVQGDCTFCCTEADAPFPSAFRYFSFRREKDEAGRMISFIGIRAER